MFSVSALLTSVALLGGTPPQAPAPRIVPPPAVNAPVAAQHPYGYLWIYKLNEKGETIREVIPYYPREGDWLFFDDMSEWWTFLYKIASTAPPFHAGIVVKKPDGHLAVLEAGPDDTLWVYVLDLIPRLFTFKGILQVRRVKCELTPEQSACLTQFAEKQKGKRYAMWRLLLQGTPCKTKGGPLREACGHTLYNRKRWLCAEIVVTASALIGLTDGKKIKGSNTYPLDIIDNKLHPELAEVFEDAAYWAPHP